MTRRRLWHFLPWMAALSLLAIVLINIPLGDTWQALNRLTWRQVGLLIGLNILVLALLNLRWWIILRGYGLRLPFTALFGYRLATFGVSYFTPGPHFGGEPLQVLLVEKEHQTPRSTAIAAMTIDKSLELVVNFIFLLAGVVLIIQQRLVSGSIGTGVILAGILLLLAPLVYLLVVSQGRTPLHRLAVQVESWVNRWPDRRWQARFQNVSATVQSSEQDISRLLREAPWSLFLALLVSFTAWLFMIAEFWLMVLFLGVPLSTLQLVTVLTAARLAILLLMPAGIGVLEASQALAFAAIGLNPALGISASLLIRARDVAMGGLGLWWGSKKLSAAYLAVNPVEVETHE